MSRIARFRVSGRLDRASVASEGTVSIDRATGIVEVRPLRRRKTYQMPLAEVARWIVEVNVRAEVAEKKARKRKRKP